MPFKMHVAMQVVGHELRISHDMVLYTRGAICHPTLMSCIDLIESIMTMGVDNIIIHNVNRDHESFIRDFGRHVLPMCEEAYREILRSINVVLTFEERKGQWIEAIEGANETRLEIKYLPQFF
jgi:hypothetical protein